MAGVGITSRILHRTFSNRVFVVGVGMTKFEKPGSRKNFDYPDMAKEAGHRALEDAGIIFVYKIYNHPVTLSKVEKI